MASEIGFGIFLSVIFFLVIYWVLVGQRKQRELLGENK